MREGPDIARIASLVGDPARANMLNALMGGTALTASELAMEAGVSLPTASSHLGKLLEGGLLTVASQGRHRYYGLAGPQVAGMIEAITGVAASVGPQRVRPGPRDAAMRVARVCYDHLAGEQAVAMLDRLVDKNILLRRTRRSGSGRRPLRISPRSASTSPPSRDGRCAAPAWTGACGARIWPARWAPPSSTRSSRKNGRDARRTAAPWCFRRWASRRSRGCF